MTTRATDEVAEVFGDEGALRNRFHTRRGSKVINRFTRPFWGLIPPAGFGVLTTVGRRTGQDRRRCVRVVLCGQKAFLVSIVGERAEWVRNIRQNDVVHLRARHTTTRARARDVVEGAEASEARTAFCDTLNLSDYVECFLHRKGRPSKSRIRQLHERWFELGTPLVLDLERSDR